LIIQKPQTYAVFLTMPMLALCFIGWFGWNYDIL